MHGTWCLSFAFTVEAETHARKGLKSNCSFHFSSAELEPRLPGAAAQWSPCVLCPPCKGIWSILLSSPALLLFTRNKPDTRLQTCCPHLTFLLPREKAKPLPPLSSQPGPSIPFLPPGSSLGSHRSSAAAPLSSGSHPLCHVYKSGFYIFVLKDIGAL